MIFVPHLTFQWIISVSFSTMKLRFLYSTVPTLESIVGTVVTTSPSSNSNCLLLALQFCRLLLALLFSPAVGPPFPAVVAPFTCCGSAHLSYCHLDHPFYHHWQVYWVCWRLAGAAAGCPSRPAWRSRVPHAPLRAARGLLDWPAPLFSSFRAPRVKVCDLRAQLHWLFVALANGLSMTSIVLRVYCFGLWAYVPPKLFEFCNHRCVLEKVTTGF